MGGMDPIDLTPLCEFSPEPLAPRRIVQTDPFFRPFPSTRPRYSMRVVAPVRFARVATEVGPAFNAPG